MKKLRKNLYEVSRNLNKAANILGDIESFVTMNPKKIGKRLMNKKKNQFIYKNANKISRKITKK